MRFCPNATIVLSKEGVESIPGHYHQPWKFQAVGTGDCLNIGRRELRFIEAPMLHWPDSMFTYVAGKFELADTGTVMLDEIGDVPANIQIKLLRVLQEREFERLGSNKTMHIDVRVIAATNRDLRVALEDGTFREDLYYRLNVVPIEIPPLRERKEDIPYLARHFVEKLAPDTGGRVRGITDAAIDKLMGYSWPGNVRELENVIERSIVMASGEQLDAEEIRLDMNLRARPVAGELALPEGMSLDAWEQELIKNALKQAEGNKSQAARILGLTRNALRYRLTQMGIES